MIYPNIKLITKWPPTYSKMNWQVSGKVTSCPGKWGSSSLGVFKSHVDVELGTWFGSGRGSVDLLVGLDDVKCLFQP